MQLKSKYLAFITIFLSIVLFASALIGCSSQSTNTTTSPVTTGDAVLTIVKGTQTSTYTMSSLKALPVTSGWAGQMSSTGTITGPYQYKGVALTEILKAVGGITETDAVRVSAKDGYAMTLSYNQVMHGSGFPILDSTTGKEVAAANTPVVFLAFEQDGKPIDDTVGPIRLGVMTSNTQVTDGHWWVKWAQKIEVVPTVQPWTISLEGAITEKMDQATFESGAAIGCHGVKYTDADGHVYEGIPLYYLIGRVDDAVDTHKGDAFSDALADSGYEVHLVAADGYEVTLTSAETKRNEGMIVAYKMDGKSLVDKNWPLRLVGSNVTKQKQIGGIAKMKLVFPGSSTTTVTNTTATTTASVTTSTTTTSVPSGPTVLTVITGGKTTTFSLADLKKFMPVIGSGGTKNKTGVVNGPFPYQGVALTTVLTSAGGSSGGLSSNQNVVLTASDGYSKTITYDQLMNGTFTTYDTTGTAVTPTTKPTVTLVYSANDADLDSSTGPVELGLIFSGSYVSDGSWWVKMVVKIEVVTAP